MTLKPVPRPSEQESWTHAVPGSRGVVRPHRCGGPVRQRGNARHRNPNSHNNGTSNGTNNGTNADAILSHNTANHDDDDMGHGC
ncbi:MAG: hypothetical protein ACYDDU_03375 [Dermatophilaceae bacterium]